MVLQSVSKFTILLTICNTENISNSFKASYKCYFGVIFYFKKSVSIMENSFNLARVKRITKH